MSSVQYFLLNVVDSFTLEFCKQSAYCQSDSGEIRMGPTRARMQSNASGNSFGPLGSWNNRLCLSLCSESVSSNSLKNSTPYIYLATRAPTW